MWQPDPVSLTVSLYVYLSAHPLFYVLPLTSDIPAQFFSHARALEVEEWSLHPVLVRTPWPLGPSSITFSNSWLPRSSVSFVTVHGKSTGWDSSSKHNSRAEALLSCCGHVLSSRFPLTTHTADPGLRFPSGSRRVSTAKTLAGPVKPPFLVPLTLFLSWTRQT